MFIRKNSQTPFPLEIVSLILGYYSSLETVSRVMRVNKEWRSLILGDQFWQVKYKKHFPSCYAELKNPEAVNWYQEFLDAFNRNYMALEEDPQQRFLLSLIKERDFGRLKEKSEEVTKRLLTERRQFRHAVRPVRDELSFLYCAQLRNDQEMLDYFYQCTQAQQFDEQEQRLAASKDGTTRGWLRTWAIACRQDVGEILLLILPPEEEDPSFYWNQEEEREKVFLEAAHYGHLSLLQELHKDTSRQLPALEQLIRWAGLSGSLSTFKFIMDECLPEEKRNILFAVLKDVFEDACQMGHIEIIKDLLGRYPALKKVNGPIQESIMRGSVALVQVLFKHGPEFFSCVKEDGDLSPLSPSTGGKDIELLYEAIRADCTLIVRYLLECGYDVNALQQTALNEQEAKSTSSPSDERGEGRYSTYKTPLFYAASEKRHRIMQILLEWGASRKIAFDCAMARKNIQAAIALLQTQTLGPLPPTGSARPAPSADPEENKNMARVLILGYAENLQGNSNASSIYIKNKLFKTFRVKQAAIELKKMFLEEQKDEESKAASSVLESYQVELTKGELGDIYRIAKQFFPEKGLPDFKDKPPSQQSSPIRVCSIH
jgi:hypothetical protein